MTQSINDNSSISFQMELLTPFRVELMILRFKENTATGHAELSAFLLCKLAKAIAPNITLILNTNKIALFLVVGRKIMSQLYIEKQRFKI